MDLIHTPEHLIHPRNYLPQVFKDFMGEWRDTWINDFKNELIRLHLVDDHWGFTQCILDNTSVLEVVKIDTELWTFLLEIIMKRLFDPSSVCLSEVLNLLNFLRNFMMCKKKKINVQVDWRYIYNFIYSLYFSAESNYLYSSTLFYGWEGSLEILG